MTHLTRNILHHWNFSSVPHSSTQIILQHENITGLSACSNYFLPHLVFSIFHPLSCTEVTLTSCGWKIQTEPVKNHLLLLSLFILPWLLTGWDIKQAHPPAPTPWGFFNFKLNDAITGHQHTLWPHQTTPYNPNLWNNTNTKTWPKKELSRIHFLYNTVYNCIVSSGQCYVYTISFIDAQPNPGTSVKVCDAGWLLVCTLLETIMATDGPIILTCWS